MNISIRNNYILFSLSFFDEYIFVSTLFQFNVNAQFLRVFKQLYERVIQFEFVLTAFIVVPM